MGRNRARFRAFTLIEVIVSLSIISLLMSIGLPALSRARRLAASSLCLDHLRSLASSSSAYASDDSSGHLLPAHPISDANELHDEGFFDYGGASGAENVWGGDRWGPRSPRSAPTRPLNRMLFGAAAEGTDYSLYRCPSDEGLPDRAYLGLGDYWDAAMSRQPLFYSVGTSYWGNAYRVLAASDDRPGKGFWSLGVFLRPANRVPVAAESVLYCEAIAWHQVVRTGNAGGGPAFRLAGGKSWHGDQRFNLAYCDGHAAAVRMSAGLLAEGSDSSDPVLASVHIRGSGFRFDCRPDEVIQDRPD